MNHVLFDRDFETELASELKQKEDAAKAPSPHSADEIEAMLSAARAQAHESGKAEGHALGLEEAARSTDAKLAQAVLGLQDVFAALHGGMSEHHAAVEVELTGLLRTLCEKIVPQALKTYSDDNLRTELLAIARRAQGSRWLEIRVPNVHEEAARALFGALLGDTNDGRTVRIVADAGLGQDEMKASWRGGSSSFSHAKICNKIMESLFGDEYALTDKLEKLDGDEEK